MEKIILISMPMTADVQKKEYKGADESIPVGKTPASFPVIPFLQSNIGEKEKLKIVMIAKVSDYSKADQFIELFKKEISEALQDKQVELTYETINSDFSEEAIIHEQLMNDIVEKVPDKSKIIADITYGPKDLPIIMFSALNFAERFLGCEIENIIYGQGFFNDKKDFVEPTVCDLSALYSLNSLTNTLKCDSPENARMLLKTIIDN